jgi:hypothetical protein
MLDQLEWAEFVLADVLAVCTETYYRRFRGHEEPGKGKGADWEGNLTTTEIYNAKSTKFWPVLFECISSPTPVRKGRVPLPTGDVDPRKSIGSGAPLCGDMPRKLRAPAKKDAPSEGSSTAGISRASNSSQERLIRNPGDDPGK